MILMNKTLKNRLGAFVKYFFGLNQKIRTYIRVLVESAIGMTVYMYWFINASVGSEIGYLFHLLNLMIWITSYFILGLHYDRIRFSSVTTYRAIVYLASIFTSVLVAEVIVLEGKIDIVLHLFVLLLLSNTLISLRLFVREIIRYFRVNKRENILVFGTSEIAIDFANAAAFSKKYNVVGFICDNYVNPGRLCGLPVILMEDVKVFSESKNCKLVVIAHETDSLNNKKWILNKLDQFGLSVNYAPTMDRAFDYEIQLKAVKPEDVLGRHEIIEIEEALVDELRLKTILVTGAGGTIGSELCRQIITYNPKKIIMLELNEFALYSIEQEISGLRKKQLKDISIVYVLGSVLDQKILNSIFENHKVDFIYHAAAYKHVPIVEDNIPASVENNVFGTKLIAEYADLFKVTKFVLISSDKAVRPTNVMGATKRLAELIIQDVSNSSKTKFTMVRFGNVLGSSGSVIPKFKSQINQGGPVTVTHEQITRYFMSTPEAANLVLNAGLLTKGGEVFLLEMGDPVSIKNLAMSMIRHHGLQPVFESELKNREKLSNEILIRFAGLRPGEKLYEELLIDGIAEKTTHRKIFKSRENPMESAELENIFNLLQQHVQKNDSNAILELLHKLPISYQPLQTLETPKIDKCDIHAGVEELPKQTSSQQPTIANNSEKNGFQLIKRILSSKLAIRLLHQYFLMKRGMTLGVRVIVLNQANEILLVRHSYIPGWYLPGGGVDHGETLEYAARREIFGEVGIHDINFSDQLFLRLNKAISRKDHVVFFLANTREKVRNSPSIEISELKYFKVDELPSDIDKLCLEAIEFYTKQLENIFQK